jgi:tetratricopeptide (TPR) repeat protein
MYSCCHGRLLPHDLVSAAAAAVISKQEAMDRRARKANQLQRAPGGGLQLQLQLNPYCPLSFERLPGESTSVKHDAESVKYQAECELVSRASPLPGSSLAAAEEHRSEFSSSAAFSAHQKMEAMGHKDPAQAVAIAEAALAISPHCAEAYNVLASYRASSYEEALALFRRGAELGPKVYTDSAWQEAVREGAMHLNAPLRGVLRSVHGGANTLRKMGRWQEAYDTWQPLFAYDPSWCAALGRGWLARCAAHGPGGWRAAQRRPPPPPGAP